MALILALNPGNSHSPTLSRLARELRGSAIVGAESCVVAIKAIDEQVPDLILLPAKSARGEADLLAHLQTVPGGVLTLKLPPVESADPVDLARQIREMLTGEPASTHSNSVSAGVTSPGAAPHAGVSPQLLAAATAAITWIRTRRAAWVDELPVDVSPEPVAQWTGAFPTKSHWSDEATEHYETYQPIDADDSRPVHDPNATHDSGRSHETYASYATDIKRWLPRAAVLAAVVAVIGGLVAYWPQIRGAISSAVLQVNAPTEVPGTAEVNPAPVVPQPAADPEPDPLANVSGWVAVFSPFDIQISEGNQGIRVDDRGRAMLAPGRHRLRFQNRELGYDETRTVEVRPTETTTINLTPQTTIGVTSNEPAEVWIDGERAGDTPYDGRVGLGTHTVTVRTSSAERQLTIAATSKPVQLEVDFTKP